MNLRYVLLTCCLILSFTVMAQDTFFKYMFYGYADGRNSRLKECATLANDDFVIRKSVSGHGVNGNYLVQYDKLIQNAKLIRAKDTFKFAFPEFSEVTHFFPVDEGFIYSHFETNGSVYRYITVFCDEHGRQKRFTANYNLNQLSHSSVWGTVGVNFRSSIVKIDTNGKIIFTKQLKSINKFNLLIDKKRIFCGPVKSNSLLVITNQKDSAQFILFDSSGSILSDSLYIDRHLVDIVFTDTEIITVEKDSNYHIIIRDLSLKEKSKYSIENNFNIEYNRIIVNESRISLALYNHVDGETYGTKTIPEIRVLDRKGKYLKKRYLRYTHNKVWGTPRNGWGILVNGIDYTSSNGYYLSVNIEPDNYGGHYGIIKLNSDLVANDTIDINTYKLDLNLNDTVLLPIDIRISTNIYDKKTVLLIYPNPASNFITISSKSDLKANLVLLDLQGKEMFQSTFAGKQKEIDVSHFNSGVYLLVLKTQKGIIRKKIIIEKE